MEIKVGHKEENIGNCIQGDQKDFKMITTSTGHYGWALEILKKGEKEIMYLEEREEDFNSLASICM